MTRRLSLCFISLLFLLSFPSFADEEVSIFAVPQATPAPTASANSEDAASSGAAEQGEEKSNYLPMSDGSMQITISAAGDTTFGGDVRSRRLSLFDQELRKRGGDLSFVTKNIRELLAQDDMTIVNFETTLTTAPVFKKNNEFVFSAPPEYVEILTSGSIEAVSFENNHALDHGEAGIEETRRHLTEAGIVYSMEDVMGVYEVKGVRIGMLAYQTFNNQYPRLYEKVPLDVARARETCDIVIVSYHWGAEKDYAPNENQQTLGRLTIDAGADLVIGHHSHRINPIEFYNGRYIVYSLANFSFAGNNKPSDMSSFLIQVRFYVKDGVAQTNSFRIVPFRISSKADYNDFVPTPFSDQRLIDNVISVLKSNGAKLPHAVENYPTDWE